MSTILRARAQLVALAASAIDPDTRRQWIEVMPTADKARNGRWYFTITRDDLDTYAAAIAANAERIMVDRDHEGAAGGTTKAAGWFTGATKIVEDPDRGAILTAEVEWTPTAAQEIEDGEFRFISAEFSFENHDKKTGLATKAKDFIAATLTNRPFFSELAAVAAEDGPVLWDADQGVNQLQQNIAEALNPGAANYDLIRYWVCDVDVAGQRALITAAGPGDDAWIVPFDTDADGNVTVPPSADWIPVEQAWVADTDDGAGMASLANRFTALANHISERITAHGGSAATNQEAHVSEELKALAATLGLPEDATVEQITEAAETAKAGADRTAELETELATVKASGNGGGDRVVTMDKEQLDQLRRDAEQGVTARKAQLSAEADQLVTAAVDDGRITPASRQDWRTAILPEGATELVDAEAQALASLAKGRIPVKERVIAATASTAQAQLDNVRAHLGLRPVNH